MSTRENHTSHNISQIPRTAGKSIKTIFALHRSRCTIFAEIALHDIYQNREPEVERGREEGEF